MNKAFISMNLALISLLCLERKLFINANRCQGRTLSGKSSYLFLVWNKTNNNHTRGRHHQIVDVGMPMTVFKVLFMMREQSQTKKLVLCLHLRSSSLPWPFLYSKSEEQVSESSQGLGRSCFSQQSIIRYPEAAFLGQMTSGVLFFQPSTVQFCILYTFKM